GHPSARTAPARRPHPHPLLRRGAHGAHASHSAPPPATPSRDSHPPTPAAAPQSPLHPTPPRTLARLRTGASERTQVGSASWFQPLSASRRTRSTRYHHLTELLLTMNNTNARRFRPALLTILLFSLPAAAQDIHVKVDPHGPGSTASSTDYTSIQQALDHAPQAAAPYRTIIEIVPGTYHERINITRNRPRITLLGLGKSPQDVVITNSMNARQAGGTFFTETAQINGDQFEADNVTFENSAGPTGQAVAAAVRSDRAIFKHCRFLGDQDTLFADFGRQYYVDSFIAGGVDFIFGNATAVFDHDTISEIRNGQITAQSRTSPEQTTGYVIDHSRITHDPVPPAPGKTAGAGFGLGRPWRAYARVIVMNTELPADLNPAGWSAWNPRDAAAPTAYYAEFHNTGPGANTPQRVPWSHQLTAKEAAAFEPQTFLRGTNSEAYWNPVTEAAKLP